MSKYEIDKGTSAGLSEKKSSRGTTPVPIYHPILGDPADLPATLGNDVGMDIAISRLGKNSPDPTMTF